MNDHSDDDFKKLLIGDVKLKRYFSDPLHPNEALLIQRKYSK